MPTTPNRISLLKKIVETNPEFSSYLEIGCRKDECFSQINVKNKVGVDFIEGGTHRMTSNEFFQSNELKFDLIFIDGDHTCDQAFKDISNSLSCLKNGGIIVAHDCFPPSAEYENEENIKCGNAWKAFVHFRRMESLDTACGNFDYGCGVIMTRPNQNVPKSLSVISRYDSLSTRDLNYDQLLKNSDDWLNVMSFSNLMEWINQKEK